MVFSSPIFIFFFLPAVLVLYFIVGKKLRNLLLLAASLFFYAWGEAGYSIFLVFSIIINYFFGIAVAKKEKKKMWLILAVVVNILMLGVFKYASFFVDNINIIFNIFGEFKIDTPHIRLPIGISFFTFQALSYVIDVYRGKVHYQKNILDLGLYVSLFPQLIAGPIVRYSDVQQEIEKRTVTFDLFVSGVSRFIVGIAKKVIIANTVAQVADSIFVLPSDQIGMSLAWLAILCYTFQIYFDFSGYSDMAIGLGRMFGFKFLENFNYPYISASIQEFWRRWHISLSSWFKDYLYIPLGGNRSGKYRTYVNLFIVFLLTGFWHGASWNFVFWGMYYGVFLILERIGLGTLLAKMWKPIRHIYTILIVIVGWVFFRVESLNEAFYYVGTMFGFVENPIAQNMWSYINPKVMLILCFACIFSIPVIPALHKLYREKVMDVNRYFLIQKMVGFLSMIVLFFIFSLSVMLIASGTYNPFIYFRF